MEPDASAASAGDAVPEHAPSEQPPASATSAAAAAGDVATTAREEAQSEEQATAETADHDDASNEAQQSDISAAVEDVNSAAVEEVDAAAVEEVDTAAVEEVDATEVEEVDATAVEEVDAAAVEEVDAVAVEEVDATEVEEVDATAVEEVDAAAVEEVDAVAVEEVGAGGMEEVDNPVDVSAASEPAAVVDDVDASVQQENEAVAGNDTADSEENDEAMDAPIQSVDETAEKSEDPEMPEQVEPPTEQVGSTETASAEQAAVVPAMEEQVAGNEAPAVETEAGDSGSALSTHHESGYDPSAPAIETSSVPHGEDEYDPANPSPAGTPVAGSSAAGEQRPAGEQEEYDPDHPSMMSAAADEVVAMEVDQPSSTTPSHEQAATTPAKRKADDQPNASSTSPANGDADSKRPRYIDNNDIHHEDDRKHGRRRCASNDSTASSNTSKHKRHEEDHKGLSAAAWDRLMDFQSSGEFRVTQVSRAAFASVGAMPEFAQIAIIARFVRTPMRDVRDKNGQLMRIYREYQKENPQIAALQPVDAFMSDYKSDPGLFRFGYAPPQPATGVSNVQVPYQHDMPDEDAPVRHSPRQARGATPRKEPESNPPKSVDEFGRTTHSDKANTPSVPVNTPSQKSTVSDPRLASRSRQEPPLSATQTMPRSATGARAEDPRRREQPHPQSTSGAGRDPRRRGPMASLQSSPRGGQSGPSRAAVPSEMYDRLPVAVKAVVDSMRREGRLQEPLNDNVVTRLLHLPERVALQAVENFSNVDLSQVENLQGFLVGIINRVNEKAIASEKQQHRPQVPSPRGHAAATLPRGGGYGAPPQGGSVLGGPPQGGRLNGGNGGNVGGFRGQVTPMAPGPGPALYERPYEAPQDPRDPRRRQQPAQQGPPQQYGGAMRGPPQAGPGRGPGMGMPSFAALPMSVQNHIHSLVASRTLSSLEELGGKCYEVLGQLSEPLANQVLTRFAGANLSNVRNKSGFLIGVVKRARQEYGFN
ncbi:unnamed protein product [Phytophthora fragariaefolia]|uniref:Unnamed protein product n=1 Tax=Phytophthora fragariaefolia TaxID=1490495 RepID=A0A9W6XXW0_9STRA|nr:unnamed protein product [Phytophthora fragariaefolia]